MTFKMSPTRWIKEQLRISDVSTLDTDFVLVGSRIFAVQLRVLSLLTSTSTLAVLLLLRSALGISPDSYVVEIVVRVWTALFYVVLMFSALGELLARKSSSSNDHSRWMGRFYFGIIGAFAVYMCLSLAGAASEAAALVAVVTMSIFGVRKREPILFSDVSDNEKWADKLLSEEGFWRRWCPLIWTLVMLSPLILPSESWMVLFAPIVLGTLLFFLLPCFSWDVRRAAQPVDRRLAWEPVVVDYVTDKWNANLLSFVVRCVAVVSAAVCAAALLLLVVLLWKWIVS